MRLSRFNDERGATVVEHALALPLFLLILFCAIEMFRVGFVAVTTQYVASSVMRNSGISSLGQTAMRQALHDRLRDYRVNLADTDVMTYCPVDDFGTAGCAPGSYVPGAARSLMILSIEKPIEGIVLPGLARMGVRVKAQVIVRNEPA